MKLRVQRRDGSIETLTVDGPLAVTHGDPLHHFADALGTDHYFDRDGYYDGWGRAAGPGMTMEDMGRVIDDVESHREVDDRPRP